MKQNGTNLGAISAVVVVAVLFLGLVIWRLVDKKASEIDISKYNVNSIIPANDENGHIGDFVEGDPNAPVLIFEYADYQCSGCATAFPRMKKLVAEYDGKLALVYRNFLLSYHQNGTAAASAATAPSEAAVVSCLTVFVLQSPATKTPGVFVRQLSSAAT